LQKNSRAKKLILWCLVIGVVLLVSKYIGEEPESTDPLSDEDSAKVLENRNWMDLWPEKIDEKLHVFRFTPKMGGGIYQDRTIYRGDFELFTYKIGDGKLDIFWPHSHTRQTLKYTVTRVDGPKPFDLKLELRGFTDGPSVYYGRSAETASDWSWYIEGLY